MGCCVSTPTTTTTTPSENSAPPDEETVKEVLSETPKWNSSSTIAKFPPPQKQNPLFQKFPQDPIKIDHKLLLPLPLNKTEDDIISEEVSEVCSITESMISAVTTTTDRHDDDDIRHRVNASPAKMRKNRSFSGDLGGGRRDITVGKSPSKRSEQSPARRNFGSVRLIQGRDQPGLRNEPRRRDSGENSCRRSRSPATRINNNGATRSVVGRSPSARRTNQSPARLRNVTAENDGRRKEHSSTERKRPSAAANESLENPLVSLECFIFL